MAEVRAAGRLIRIAGLAVATLARTVRLAALARSSTPLPPGSLHYARLGGRFAGFNSDPAFGDDPDGLVVVDLARTDTRLLAACMGKEEAVAFQARHLARAVRPAGACPHPK